MHTSQTLEVMGEDTTTVEVVNEASPGASTRVTSWWRFSKIALALAFLAAAVYFFHEQVWIATSLEGTVTSPLITIRSPIDGAVTVNTASIGAPIHQHDALFVIEADQLDSRPRVALEAKLAATQQQILVIDRKMAELSTLRAQLQSRHQVHREATLARLETMMAETTAELNRAKAVVDRTQQEVSRATTLSAKGLIARATLDDAVLAGQQARFEVERLSAAWKRLAVERTAARNGVLVGEGYSDAPYSQQRIDELTARVIEAKWVGTGRTAELCLPIPPVVTVHAAFTAHGRRLSGPLPSFPFHHQPGCPGIQWRNSTLKHLTSCGPSPCTRLSRALTTMTTLTPLKDIGGFPSGCPPVISRSP